MFTGPGSCSIDISLACSYPSFTYVLLLSYSKVISHFSPCACTLLSLLASSLHVSAVPVINLHSSTSS